MSKISSFSGNSTTTQQFTESYKNFDFLIIGAIQTASDSYFCDIVPVDFITSYISYTYPLHIDRSISNEGTRHRYLDMYFPSNTTFCIKESNYVSLRGIWGIKVN